MKVDICSFVACPRDFRVVKLESCYRCVFYKGSTDTDKTDYVECGGVI